MKNKFIERIVRKIEFYRTWFDPIIHLNEISLLQDLKEEFEKMEDDHIPLKLALDFAFWYHNWLVDRERWDVEEDFKKFIIVKYPTP